MRSILKVMILIVPAVFMLILIAPKSSAAADTLVLSVTEAAGEVGEEVAVIIIADNAANTEGGQFVLNFDPELVKPVSIEAEALITDSASSLDMANLEYASGQVMFMWVTAAADTEDSGNLCTITFELLKEGESLLEIDEVVISPDGVDVILEPGIITVEGNGSDMGMDRDENHEVAVAQSADGEGFPGQGRGVNPVVIVLIVLAGLALAGFFVYKRLEKSGA